ncbi:hypothetical protein GAYE_PCTG30G0733 [Galdieria yellowstonensis]|jgi:hypothetical protein|uniref:Complex 1 LYR protein domain-containing protein n=1 Tax=Galdieria yellowstonensis TaxID=3028027 RepID=A0AAV9I320_9RHOD|nr:hypothetical protein GAYE_PCTG30G0733 [Galdieria yellowstonensis]
MAMSTTKPKVLALYRHMLRCIKTLPPQVQPYYRYYVRQQFNSHADEIEEERVEEIISKSRSYIPYILNKYNNKPPS